MPITPVGSGNGPSESARFDPYASSIPPLQQLTLRSSYAGPSTDPADYVAWIRNNLLQIAKSNPSSTPDDNVRNLAQSLINNIVFPPPPFLEQTGNVQAKKAYYQNETKLSPLLDDWYKKNYSSGPLTQATVDQFIKDLPSIQDGTYGGK